MSATLAPDRSRVGIDLVTISEIADAIRRHGDRYLQRVFTEHELACCQLPGGVSAASLAGRWAAKEATIKVLRPVGPQPTWTTMEVRRLPSGACAMELSGSAADLAVRAGISSLSLSMTHDGDVAAAVVFALCADSGHPDSSTTSHELVRQLNPRTPQRKETPDD
jgi:holo-[acyl-carrier protein] synthase